MRKRECPQQKIKEQYFHKEKGSIEWVTGLFFILFLSVFLCAGMQLELYRNSSLYLEDALAASNLASALIDVEEYGVSNQICITNVEDSYRRYLEAVKKNLNLNEQWEAVNTTLISGKVEIVNYIVYNVQKSRDEEEQLPRLIVTTVDSDGRISARTGNLGQERAPNGVLIEETGVYSELTFPVKGWFGTIVQARKGKLVDIVSNKF